MPPDSVSDPIGSGLFLPAPELVEWARATFIDPEGALTNPAHAHLEMAHIGALWTDETAVSQQRGIAGTAEIPTFRGKPWVKARQEAQVREWFGRVPDFLLTFYAPYAASLDDATWCALVEHELYHCAQAIDRWGGPRFHRDGSPMFAIRGHDVEEFVGVVRRYGAGAAAGETAALVEVAKGEPEIAQAKLELACGTCTRLAA